MAEAVAQEGVREPAHRPVLVVAGASLGTLFEWYDFFLYGALASYIARHFFAGASDSTAFLFALMAFAAGFIARPFGALVFGRIGDVVGRKNTFLATMLIMGLSTFLVGLLPGEGTIGIAAPLLLVALRLVQGLAVGGEYGGAAIYVAEHARPNRRAFHTSWINMMATSGLILSLLVVVGFRLILSEADFQVWGWRLPFLLSALLLAVSLWIRLRLGESPVYQRMKEGKSVSQTPLSEAFGRWSNLKLILISLGVVSGSTVLWYGSQFYALFFLQRVLKVDDLTTNLMVAAALVVAAPSYLLFGWLSDRIGRKTVMLVGLAVGAAAIFPAFQALTVAANPALAAAQRSAPVAVHADPATCSVQFDPIGINTFDATGCDVAKSHLSREGVSYASVDLPAGAPTQVQVGTRTLIAPEPASLAAEARPGAIAAFKAETKAALEAAGYPAKADPAAINHAAVIALVAVLAMLAAMTYAPIAAFLVELFPARIRYTSLSFPYHLGSGWVGGLLPATAFAIVAMTGDIYSGLWYPVAFASLGVVVCLLLVPETRGRPIDG